MTVYADFQAMFNAFTSGQVDITDWPMEPSQVASFCANVDFFCTNPEGELGIFQLDINRHHPFLGKAFLSSRTIPATGLTFNTAPSGVCTVGSRTNRFIVNLVNLEAGAIVKDPLNSVRVTHTSGSPSAIVRGTLANNQYSTPCLRFGPYNIDTSVYRGLGSVPTVGPGLDITVNLDVVYNSDSNSELTADGINVARGLAHLLDKPNFVNGTALSGLATFTDVQAAPAQGLIPCPQGTPSGCGNNMSGEAPTASQIPQSILDEDLASHTWFNNSLVSGYNLVNDSNPAAPWWASTSQPGRGWSRAADIEAACDHFVLVGFATTSGDCAALGAIASGATTPACASPFVYTCPRLVLSGGKNQIIIYPRTHPPRRDFSRIIGDSINLLFGTPGGVANNVVTTCVVNYGYLAPGVGCPFQGYSISQIFDVVYSIDTPGGSPPGQNTIDDWHLYSGGFSLASTPNHLWALYHSDFTGGQTIGGCAGALEGFPTNYGLFCDPLFDTDSVSGQFSANMADASAFFSRAAIIGHRDVMTIPVFSPSNRFVALNGWNFQPGNQSSLVPQLGNGLQQGFWSLMNMRQKPGFVPADTAYTPGGGSPDFIRRGFSQEVHKLSLFHGLTVWDFEVMGQIYDSMLAVNPRNGGHGSETIDWMTTSHSQTFNPTELSTVPDGTSFTGTTTQTWRLRSDIRFHNGAAVTADDVCFSILAFQNVPSALLQASTSTVASCIVLNTKTVQVKHILQSAFYELNIGGLPILPASIWGPVCSWPGALHDSTTMPSVATLQASTCGNPAYDPMVSGTMIRSGPWVCKNPASFIGGPCTNSGTQDVVPGGTIRLERNKGFARCCPDFHNTSLQKLSWADKDDDGAVTILDIADAGLRFNQLDAYWDHPLFGVTDGTVDTKEITTIASYFDHGLTKPFAPDALISIDTEIDPFILQGVLAQGCKSEQVGVGQQRITCLVVGNTTANNADLTGQANVLDQPGGFNGGIGKTIYVFDLGVFPSGNYKFKIRSTGIEIEFTV